MDAGQRFGSYRIEAQVGRGGMGVVHEAYDTVRERRVALKVLSPELADDEGYRARFLHEARTVAGLSSPHVVPVHDFGVVDGQLFLDMALIDGSDLAAVLASGPLAPARAVALVEQVADALDTAHERGLVHRDVKAANVLVVRRRTDQLDFVYLSDFGLARSTAPSAGAAGLTAVGTVVGTAECMSPEQIEGRPVDARSDVYALGCLLFHCLTGTAPFTTTADGRPASAISVLDAHRAAPVPLLPPGGPWGSLDLVLATAMAKDPAHRYASAGALARAAREALSAAPALARTPVPAMAPAMAPATAPATAPAVAPTAPAVAPTAPAFALAPAAPAFAHAPAAFGSAETVAAPARTAPTTAPTSAPAGLAAAAAPTTAAPPGPAVPAVPTGPFGQAPGHSGPPLPPVALVPPQRKGLGTGAVIGIVGGSLAVLGLLAAGGLLAVNALSDDEPTVASSSAPRPSASAPSSPSPSSSSASPSTPVTPAPPATIPNPALGATTVVALDDAHRALLAALPRELNDCDAIGSDPYGGVTATAAVGCLGTNLPGGSVLAMSFADEASRDTAFNAYTDMPTNTNGQCPNNSGAGPWTTPSGAVGGTVACYQVVNDPEDPDAGSHAVMAWTVTGSPVFLVALDPYSSLVPPLVEWQEAHAADYAATVPNPAASGAPAAAGAPAAPATPAAPASEV